MAQLNHSKGTTNGHVNNHVHCEVKGEDTYMSVAIITGSAGLIGSEAARHFNSLGMHVVGIDNNMREYFFGKEGSTKWMEKNLVNLNGYEHRSSDIRNAEEIFGIFRHFGSDVKLVIHTAAQPSHDWAAQEPFTDFSVNAN